MQAHDGKPQVEQANDYFPFGMSFESKLPLLTKSGSGNNRFKYNGKEEQEMPGGWLDYGFRFYDPSIVRFGTMDPIADLFSWQSSYAYAANNPIRYIDFMGMSPVGADGLTNDQWLETSRPGADPELKKKYIAQNRDQEHQKRQMASVFSMSPEELSKRGFSGYYVTNSDGEILSHTVDGMGTFYSGGGAKWQGDSWETTALNHSGKTLGGIGLFNKGRELAEWEYLRQARYNRALSGDFSKPIKHSLRGLKNTGRVLGGAGIVLSGIDMGVNGVNVSNSLDLVMGGVAFIPVAGWTVSGTYFIANITTELITGQSIGEHIQGTFADPNASWKAW
jgi:RHS repeat-associated protein